MKIRLDWLAITTFARIDGVRAFIEVMEQALPEIETRQRDDLKTQASLHSWDYADYDIERQILDDRFGRWMPRLSAYSAVTLLHTVVETQLFACAERVGRRDDIALFRPRDLLASRRATMDIALLYLGRAGVFVEKDPSWQRLKDLQHLRDIIVHRGGTRGETPSHQTLFDGLLQRHQPQLSLPDPSAWHPEIWVSIPFCRGMAEEVGWFFARTLRAIGLDDEVIPSEYRA